MPERQRGRSPRPERSNATEREPQRYIRAARYPDEHSSETPYDAIRNLLYQTPCDLSVYRIRLGQDLDWHVAALGSPPPEALVRRLETLLATGQSVTLDEDIVRYLFARRAEQSAQGPWIEHRHVPRNRRLR